MPEVTGDSSGGHDEKVVRQGRRLAQNHPLSSRIDANRLREQDPRVLLPAQHTANGDRDLGRRQAGHGHLVEQRLEQVVVSSIDKCHLHGLTCKRTSYRQAAKTASDDDNLFAKLASHERNAWPHSVRYNFVLARFA